MAQPKPLESLAELHDLLADGNRLIVKWKIRPDFGPDWTERSREFVFQDIAGISLSNKLQSTITSELTNVLNIPFETEEHVIDGECTIINYGNGFHGRYSWSQTIPYLYPDREVSGDTDLFASANPK